MDVLYPQHIFGLYEEQCNDTRADQGLPSVILLYFHCHSNAIMHKGIHSNACIKAWTYSCIHSNSFFTHDTALTASKYSEDISLRLKLSFPPPHLHMLTTILKMKDLNHTPFIDWQTRAERRAWPRWTTVSGSWPWPGQQAQTHLSSRWTSAGEWVSGEGAGSRDEIRDGWSGITINVL